jgi:cellobiose phosphorylase
MNMNKSIRIFLIALSFLSTWLLTTSESFGQKPYGSGYFGSWITDESGLPAYNYTCNQYTDPKAITPTYKEWRLSTDQSHEVGNDRLVGVASNYGYIQIRQDEGSPKFLNDYNPSAKQFGGGFGYLTDGKTVLSTFYNGKNSQFERVFGIGYYRKKVKNENYGVDQVLYAPFGDDPVIISQVTITNHSKVTSNLRWIEYWGVKSYQFSWRANVQAMLTKKADLRFIPEFRRQLAEKFITSVSAIPKGLKATSVFNGYSEDEKKQWESLEKIMAGVGKGFFGDLVIAPIKEISYEDYAPAPTFLVSLNGKPAATGNDAISFFGEGGTELPDGVFESLYSSSGSEVPAMLVEEKVSLKPGESKTLYFMYGYLPEGYSIDNLLNRYTSKRKKGFSISSNQWKSDRMRFSVAGSDWIDREMAWNYYYLRGNLTYDSFFKEHILSQGNVYQYLLGAQIAMRDPLQHALPFILNNPQIVRDQIRYTLKMMKEDGEIPYGITGFGHNVPLEFRPSDHELWLLWLTSEYVLATKDIDFLYEEIPTYPIYTKDNPKKTVIELLKIAYNHYTVISGTGRHKIQRLSNGDWNDAVVTAYVKNEDKPSVKNEGESVLNAAMTPYVLDLFASLLTFMKDTAIVPEVCLYAGTQRKAVEEQWNGKWYKRAYLSEKLGWIGDDLLWLEPQPWAIISNITNDDQKEILTEQIDNLVRKPCLIGARLMSGPANEVLNGTKTAGVLTNGGVWPSINGTLIWALTKSNPALAWDEYKKNSFANHADKYPDVWYGIWSGPDSYNSDLSRYPGQTMFNESILGGEETNMIGKINWTDFPVMNMHPHAWQLYSVAKLLGIEFTGNGLCLAPVIPENEYQFYSKLISFKRINNRFEASYQPVREGIYEISIKLPVKPSILKVNGKKESIQIDNQGNVFFTGKGGGTKALTFEIQ